MTITTQFGLSSEHCKVLIDTLKDANFNDKVSIIEQNMYETDKDAMFNNICIREQLIGMFKAGVRDEKPKPAFQCIKGGKQ